MEENSELEEGEAPFYNKYDDDNNIDPEISLSYIDEKIQNVLGHFQKYFEGGVTAENLGAKFGGYGSFLPAYERSSSIFSRPKSPEKGSSAPKSPKQFNVEGARQGSTVPLSANPCVRVDKLHDSGTAPEKFSIKQESGLPAFPFSQKSASQDENSNRSSKLSDHRPLKVRIKVGPDSKARNKAAILHGLGLDNSPSLSLGNSHDESGGMSSLSEVVVNESPTNILQVMTSFPLHGDVLISPLQESLLGLMRKERVLSSGKSSKSNRGHPSMLADELGAVLGNGKPLREEERILKESGNDVEERQGNDTNLENGVEPSVTKKSQNGSFKDKDVLSNNLERTNLSRGEYAPDHAEVTGSAFVVYKEPSVDGARERSQSLDMGRKLSRSVSSQDSGKNESRNPPSSSEENMLAGRSLISKNGVLVKEEVSGRGNSRKVAPSKANSDAVKCKENFDIELFTSPGEHVGQKASFGEQDETSLPSEKDKLVIQGKKKPQGIQYSKKEVGVSPIESSRGGVSVVPKNTYIASHHTSNSNTKRQKLKSQKDINKVRVGDRGPKRKSDSVLEMEQIASFETSNKKPCTTGDVNQQLPVAFVSPNPPNPPTSEVVQPPTDVVLIHENWVQCDRCEKWRLLPYGMDSEKLPDRWRCSMQKWLPGLNRCDVSDEETSKVMRALNQIPVGGQNNIQSNGSGNAVGVLLPHVQPPDKNYYGLSTHATSPQEDKKNIVNKTSKAGTSCGLIRTSDSVKSKSMKRENQPSSEPNPTEKSGVLCLRQLQNLAVGKQKDKNRENQINGGEARPIKIKNKRVDDDGNHSPPKKASKEDLADKRGNLDKDLERDGASLNVTKHDVRDKRRKLRDWQENQNGHERHMNVENGEIGLKKEKKFRVLKSVAKDSSGNDALNKLDEKITADKIQMLCSNHHLVDGVEFRNTAQDKLPMKHRRKSVPQSTSDDANLVRKGSGAPHALLTTTSSSSKVSSTHKTRPTFDEARGSPGESVSSSPLRILAPEKSTSAGIDIFGKDHDGPVGGGPPAVGERSYSHGKGNDGRNPLVTTGKEKITAGLCSGSFDGDVKTLEYCNDYGEVGRTHDIDFASDYEEDNMDPSNFGGESGDFHSKRKTDHASEIGSESDVVNYKRINCMKHGISEKSSPKSSKGERDCACKGVVGGFQLGRKSDNPVELEHSRKADVNVGLLRHKNHGAFVQENLHHVSRDQMKMDPTQRENQSGTFKTKHERILAGSEQGYAFDGSNCDLSKVRGHPENVGSKTVAQQSLGHCAADLAEARDPTPARAYSANPTAEDVLQEAKAIREKADRFKDSGFGFESNELYFQAALKFLHGGSLMETCSSEIAREVDMTVIQVYSTVATLCKCCALEYESRKDMMAAALAYKCMEIAHWRVVYCKNSSLSKDWNELQASLRFLPQGDSPSSSASDIDNLNNQATTDKTLVSKSSVSLVSGNPVIAAQNHSNLLRLLDFTQDVNFAVEASRKSQSAFSAANAATEKAVNRECLSSVKRVINFSFQDIEGLIHLVQLAMKAVNHSGLGGARN